MVDPEFQDLVPLFFAEGQRRVERLLELVPRTDGKPENRDCAVEARRELHTLKGSARMLKLLDLSELCHRGETLLQEPDASTPDTLVGLLDQVSGMLEALVEPTGDEGRETPPEAAADDDEAAEAPEPEVAVTEAGIATEHRISAETADRLTGTAASMRLLAVTGLNSSQRLAELAKLAEDGVTETLPRQVLAMLATHLRQMSNDLESQQHRLQQHAEAQLKRLLDLQLQPLRPFLQSLARHARQLAHTLGKEVHVEVEGGEARLDQRIVSQLRDAFLHLVANAVDHGVESPERRLELGKPRAGQVRIAATGSGDRVEIAVADDGAGIDVGNVLDAAREDGLVAAETTALADRDVLQLLFASGFSTRRQVSQVSGRGMGLDVVSTKVRQLGGDVWIESENGAGSTIRVEVPAMRRGERVLVLRCGYDLVACPKSAIRWVRSATGLEVQAGTDEPVVAVDGTLWRTLSLADAIGGSQDKEDQVLIALEVAGSGRVLSVESVVREEEVLLRPFGRSVRVPDFYLGLALLSSGVPVAVLSPSALVSRLHQAAPAPKVSLAPSQDRLRVLLVEDSLVTREMERRMLEEEGFLVTTTASAEEALGRLAEEAFDCLVTDLEMPDMDGFELTRHVRRTRHLAHLPIVVVSTRDGSGDRLAGLEAGADAYISKQSLDSHKLGRLLRRLGRSR